MRRMLVLVALFVLAAFPAMAAPPDEKGAKDLVTEQKQSQEKPMASKPSAGLDGGDTGGRIYDGESGW